MKDLIYLGPAPSDEDCAQVGSEGYSERAREESARWAKLLTVIYPPPPRCAFVVKWNAHDFGSYAEVCAQFDYGDERGAEWALKVENDAPATWAEAERLAATKARLKAALEARRAKAAARRRGDA